MREEVTDPAAGTMKQATDRVRYGMEGHEQPPEMAKKKTRSSKEPGPDSRRIRRRIGAGE